MPDTPREWLPAQGRPAQLMILLHDRHQTTADMLPLAQRLQHRFPQAALLVPAGVGVEAAESPASAAAEGVAAAAAGEVPRLVRWVRDVQARLGALPQETALAGFGHGATLALELAFAHDGLVGRVLAFGGQCLALPERAPQLTTLHLLHGGADPEVPVAAARLTLQHLGVLHGDCTLDIAQEIGHELHPALIDCAIHRLTHHIPQRTWRAAMGAAPGGEHGPAGAH